MKLEDKVQKEEDERIHELVKDLTEQEEYIYYEGYADGVLYSNKLTLEVYRK